MKMKLCFKNWSLRQKLMTVSMLTTSVALLVAGGSLATYDMRQSRALVLKGLATHARVVADNSTAAVSFDSHADASQMLALLHGNPEIEAAAIYDNDGRTLATYFRDASEQAKGLNLQSIPA